MGLGDIGPGDLNTKRHFGSHPADDRLQGWVDDFKTRFPGGVQVDFIEVSRKMSKTHGRAYRDGESGEQYIRVSEKLIDNYDELYQMQIVLHEMTHLWFYENGVDHTEGDPLFNWVLGRVGADHGRTSPGHEDYEIIKRFLSQ